jgi:beta-amylase
MSFHACGGSVGDNLEIPLPNWVTEIGNQNLDIFYKDAGGTPDYEYLSLAVDNEPVLNGLTPLQVIN